MEAKRKPIYKSDGSETFVIKKAYDHWENYSYHQRYLDAMASIFAVEGPAAAITYLPKVQKFYLSYNTTPTKNTLRKKEIIENYLNKPSDPHQIKNLLFLYIAYNLDFKKSLPKNCKLFNEITNCIYAIPLGSSYNSLVMENEENISFKMKNLEIKKNQLEEVQVKINQVLNKLNDIIKELNKDRRTVIDMEYLEMKIKKRERIEEINKVRRASDTYSKMKGEEIEEINKFRCVLVDMEYLEIKGKETEIISNNEHKLISFYYNTLGTYNKLLELLSDRCIENADKSEEFYKLAKILIRPLQDVEKLSYYLKYRMSQEGLSNIKVEIVPNVELETDKVKHAEANLGKEFIGQDDLYIGVSKLCCGLCDNLLSSKYRFDYRGTHGTCSSDWGAPIHSCIGFRDKVYARSAGINQAGRGQQLSEQHRILSSDDLKSLTLDLESDHSFSFEKHIDTLLSGEINYFT